MKAILQSIFLSAVTLAVWFFCFTLFRTYCFFGGIVYAFVLLCFAVLAVFLVSLPVVEILSQVREKRQSENAIRKAEQNRRQMENAALQKAADLLAGQSVADDE